VLSTNPKKLNKKTKKNVMSESSSSLYLIGVGGIRRPFALWTGKTRG